MARLKLCPKCKKTPIAQAYKLCARCASVYVEALRAQGVPLKAKHAAKPHDEKVK